MAMSNDKNPKVYFTEVVLKYSFLAILFTQFTLIFAQAQNTKRSCFPAISKYKLIEHLKVKDIKPARLHVEIIKNGVDFNFTSIIEKEIREAVKFVDPLVPPPKKDFIWSSADVEKLIELVQNNYKFKVIILIANFQNDNPGKYEVKEKIYRQLYKETKQFPEICIDKLNEVITDTLTMQEIENFAEEKDELKANIVIWGKLVADEGFTNTIVYFTPLLRPRYLRLKQEYEETVEESVKSLETFTLRFKKPIDKTTYLILLSLGLYQFEKGGYDEALSRFDSALKVNTIPQDIINPGQLYYFRAYALNEKGIAEELNCSKDKAKEYFIEAVNSSIKAVETYQTEGSYYNLGVFLSKINRFPEALENYNKALIKNPSSRLAYYNRARIYSYQAEKSKDKKERDKLIELAIQDYTDAIKSDLHFAEAYNNLGNLKSKINRDSGIKDFEQAIKLKSNYLEAHINLARQLFITKEYEESIKTFDKAFKIIMDCNCIGTSRTIYLGGIDEAITSKPTKCSDNAKYRAIFMARLYRFRGLSKFQLGDKNKSKNSYNEAIADFSDSLELEQNFGVYWSRAISYRMLSEFEKAEKDLSEAIRLYENKGKDLNYISLLIERSKIYLDMKNWS